MNKHDLFSHHSIIQSMINLLLEKWGDTVSKMIEECWVTRFIEQHSEIKFKFVRKFHHKRFLCQNPKIINDWFKLVQRIMKKYKILKKNTYNMNEIEFAIEMISICRVIINSKRKDHPQLLQSENWQWTTVINIINASEWTLASVIIFKKKNSSSYKNEIELSSDWIIKSSLNDWINDELRLFWLKEIFNT